MLNGVAHHIDSCLFGRACDKKRLKGHGKKIFNMSIDSVNVFDFSGENEAFSIQPLLQESDLQSEKTKFIVGFFLAGAMTWAGSGTNFCSLDYILFFQSSSR